MKVFMNTRSGGYSGGMILVAANTAKEAHEAFHADPDLCSMWYSERGTDYVSDFYYQPEDWQEMPMLEAHVDKPQVLAEAGYTE